MSNFSKPEEYTIFKIPKKHGGFRQIEAPNDDLKARQRKILQEMKGMHYISPFVHSFRSGHNVVTNAKGHVGAKYVLHIDASNFFPSITYTNFRYRVSHVNAFLNGSHHDWFEHIEQCFCKFPGEEQERLPQGAPTSPWISNIYLSKFDTAMARYMTYMGVNVNRGNPTEVSEYNYSRYADDITISGPDKERLWAIFFMMERRLSRRYGITLNRRKTRMMGPGHRKVVCGIVVNEKTQPKRRWRKNLRAEIHNQLVAGKELKASTKGKIAYLNMCRNTEGYSSSESIFISRHSEILSNL